MKLNHEDIWIAKCPTILVCQIWELIIVLLIPNLGLFLLYFNASFFSVTVGDKQKTQYDVLKGAWAWKFELEKLSFNFVSTT